ncbi:tail completion protein gp17 [Falsiruegeria mediterranea]|uniref:tail completion protein gp17 n=1 Tax=Falsiruegeria mediterranea TaxID=1280832 RepID=UPI0015F28AFC|nr:DUF3168 domain-containing protein [Falsiruegeria mediterranea]
MEETLFQVLSPLGHPVVWGVFDEEQPYPQISLQQISGPGNHTLTGRGGIETARVQINVDAKTYLEARDTAAQIALALEAIRNTGGIVRCYELNRRAAHSAADGDVIRRFSLDFKVRYRA